MADMVDLDIGTLRWLRSPTLVVSVAGSMIWFIWSASDERTRLYETARVTQERLASVEHRLGTIETQLSTAQAAEIARLRMAVEEYRRGALPQRQGGPQP